MEAHQSLLHAQSVEPQRVQVEGPVRPSAGQHACMRVAGCSARLCSRAAGAADAVKHQPGPAGAGARGGERQLERPRRMDHEADVVRAVAPVAHLCGVRGACGQRMGHNSDA